MRTFKHACALSEVIKKYCRQLLRNRATTASKLGHVNILAITHIGMRGASFT